MLQSEWECTRHHMSCAYVMYCCCCCFFLLFFTFRKIQITVCNVWQSSVLVDVVDESYTIPFHSAHIGVGVFFLLLCHSIAIHLVHSISVFITPFCDSQSISIFFCVMTWHTLHKLETKTTQFVYKTFCYRMKRCLCDDFNFSLSLALYTKLMNRGENMKREQKQQKIKTSNAQRYTNNTNGDEPTEMR